VSLLDKESIKKHLSELERWELKDNAIERHYSFKSYMKSIEFINSLAAIAEERNHHPDMVVGWCAVKVSFTSHDKGGVTKKCFEMANALEKTSLKFS